MVGERVHEYRSIVVSAVDIKHLLAQLTHQGPGFNYDTYPFPLRLMAS